MLGIPAQAALPTPLVNLRFSEATGTLAVNTGSLGGEAMLQVDEAALPVLGASTAAGPYAPAANTSSVDMGMMYSTNFGRAVDLFTTGGDGSGTLGAFNQFTLCGWLNARSLAIGPGGNRIAFALDNPNGNGFDLVQLANGSLRLGINQWPDGAGGGGPSSAAGILKADPQAGVSNWVFFAVTYDPSLASGQVKYYFGSGYALAGLSSTHNYKGFDVGTGGTIPASGMLTVGNFGTVVGARNDSGNNSRVFRGLMDELRVFDTALDLAQIQEAQLNGAPPPVPVTIVQQPASTTVFEGVPVTFNVGASGSAPFSYQWQKNGADIPGATAEAYTIDNPAAGDSGTAFRVKISNSVTANVLSEAAVLTVLSDSGPRVSLSFSDGDLSVTNRGVLEGTGVYALRDGFPKSSEKVPSGTLAPGNNIASVDFGDILAGQGARAIDLTNRFGGTVGPMTAFTVAGWVNCRNLDAGWGGNRIVFALAEPGGPGFDLVQQEDGSLRLGVNQWPDAGAGGPASSPEKVTADPETGAANWVFFAVTYDSALPDNNVNYYFGTPTTAAQIDVTATYQQGPIIRPGRVTIGNFGPVAGARNEVGPNGGSRVFRGLVDEINVYGKVLTLAEIQAQQTASAYKPVIIEPATIVQQPQSMTTFAGQTLAFSVVAGGTPPLTYQWWQKQGGAESSISGATNQSYTIDAATMAQTGVEFWVVVSNQGATVTSSRAVLTVLPDNNEKVALSFSEAEGAQTANSGNVGGSAVVVQVNAYPKFTSLVPAGPEAPSNNQSALDFGVIGEGESGRALDLVPSVTPTIGAMTAFTLTGWLNCRDLQYGPGGNRILYCQSSMGSGGFDLVQEADGTLWVGVNAWPDWPVSPAKSSPRLVADPDAGAANWVFFAFTYDGASSTGNASFYFGSPTEPAALDVTVDYPNGPINVIGPLTIGNFSTVDQGARSAAGPANSRVFRGVMDEIKVFNRALTESEIRQTQKAPAAAPVVASPTLSADLQQNQFRLRWESTADFQLQFRNSLNSGNWADDNTPVVVNGNQKTVSVSAGAPARFYRLIRK